MREDRQLEKFTVPTFTSSLHSTGTYRFPTSRGNVFLSRPTLAKRIRRKFRSELDPINSPYRTPASPPPRKGPFRHVEAGTIRELASFERSWLVEHA